MGRISGIGQVLISGNLGVAIHNRRKDTRRLYRHPIPGRGNWSVRRINCLHAALPGLVKYLEIGLSSGRTFEHITIPHRVGVDPVPRFDLERLPPDVDVFVMTSDNYFATDSAYFDLVFVDGLHTYRQTYRDTIGALNASPSGAVLIDDVVPCDEVSAMPDQGESLALRRSRGMPGSPWHGDVFRMVACLSDHHPELIYRTIVDGGNPQLLVWRSDSGDIEHVTNSVLDSYESLTYANVFGSGIPHEFRPSSEAATLADAIAALQPSYG